MRSRASRVVPLVATLAALAVTLHAEEMSWTGVLSETEFKALHHRSGEKGPPTEGGMIDLAGTRSYLSLPEGEPPFPGIVVIHEWWGLNENIMHWADRLAADGYAALAVDLYGGKVATTRDEALNAMRQVDPGVALEVLQAAGRFLQETPRVHAPKLGSIGWCFGGGWSLRYAIAEPDLDAAVVYYGRLETDPEKLRAIHAPLLGIFANQDRAIPPTSVDAFEKGMTEAGRTFEIERFDAQHGFANPSSAIYDEVSAGAAWKEVRSFLRKNLE